MAERWRAEQRRNQYSHGNYLTVPVEPSEHHRRRGSQSPERRKPPLYNRGYHSDNESRRRRHEPRDSGVFHHTRTRDESHFSRHGVPDPVHSVPAVSGRSVNLPSSVRASRSTRAQVPDPPKIHQASPGRRWSTVYKHGVSRHTSDSKINGNSSLPELSRLPAGRPRSYSNTETRSRPFTSMPTRPDPPSAPRRLSNAAQTQPKIVLPIRSKSDATRSGRRNSDVSTVVAASVGTHKSFLSSSGVLGGTVYQYSPLRGLEFRLVRIFRKTLETVRCEIIHGSLADPPEYTAISYAWGDPDEKRDIELEHDVLDEEQETVRKAISVRVTVNLYGALQALRKEDRDVLVWIDGLSIDQENNEERARQVRLMSRIYGSAAAVAIWLGPEANKSNTALRILKEIAETEKASGDVAGIVASYAGNPEFGSLVSLFERDYWKRLWVVQEVFIPDPYIIHVYCGQYSNTWRTYITAATALGRCRSTIDHYFPGNKDHGHHVRVSEQHYSFAQVLALQGPTSLPGGGIRNLGKHPLLETMRLCRDKFTANPLDKVYGILGLLPEDVRRDFPVDYKSSVKGLYVRIVDHVLSTTKCLDILCEAIHFPLHTSNASLPTWCPDWYHMPATKALRNVDRFTASKDRPARYKFHGERRLKLEIEAIYLGTVVEHGVAVGTLTTSVDHLTAFLSWRALLLDKAKFRDRDDEDDLTNIFCRTLCLGQLPQYDRLLDWKTICYHVFGALLARTLPQLILDEELMYYAKLKHVMPPKERRPFLGNFTPHMMGRRFCLLDDRRLMGLGSGFIGANDVVVVPLGCSTPIVLRREGPEGEYRYVGDMYIDQYMHGKAIEQMDKGRAGLHSYILH
jgi:hypothetical protein